MRKLLLSIAACVAASVQAITWVTYDSATLPSGVKEIKINNDVDTSIDNPNQSDAQGFNLCCADGVTIKLTPKSSVDRYRFFSAIIATNGAAPTVTLDVTDFVGLPLLLHNHFHFKNDATLVIKGTNFVEFGADYNWSTYFPTFNVPHKVKFTDAAGTEVAGRIRFRDRVCLYPMPDDLDYEIADNAHVAVHSNALKFGNEITLDRYDLFLSDSTETLSQYSGSTPPGATITVKEGRCLYFFPNHVNENFRWSRDGGIISNNVILAGGSLGISTATRDATLAGSLKGYGNVIGSWTTENAWNGNWSRLTGPVCFTGAVDFACQPPYYSHSSINSSRDYRFSFQNVLPGTRITALRLGGVMKKDDNGFAFVRKTDLDLSAYDANPVVIEKIEGVNNYDTNYVSFVQASVPLTIGAFSGRSLDLRGDYPITVQTMGAQSVLRNVGQVAGPADSSTVPYGDYVYTYGSSYKLFNNFNDSIPATGKVARVKGDATVIAGNPKWELHVDEGVSPRLVPTTNRMAVVVEGGTVRVTGREVAWQELPSLWLDAAASESVTNLTVHTGYAKTYPDYSHSDADLLAPGTVYYTNGFPYVTGWYDRRPDHKTTMFWSDRYDNPWTQTAQYPNQHNIMPGTHPFRVLGGLNGKDYISFGTAKVGSRTATTHPKLAGGNYTLNGVLTENARGYFYEYGTTKWGSGYKGLKPMWAFLVFGSQNGGGYNLLGSDSQSFKRGAKDLSAPLTAHAAAIEKGRAWVDGTSVALDQSNVLNGGWQIITLNLKRLVEINTLGSPGGQNYAEIIFFEQDLSEAQRVDIELYLAEKWGLRAQYNCPEGVSPTPPVATVYGSNGTVKLEADATLSGGFAGAIDLNGQTLTLEGEDLPPDETTVDTTGCTGWYDPERADLMREQDNVSSHAPARRISRLFDRSPGGMADGRFCLSIRANTRAPWKNVSARRFGPARNWMDFCNTEQKPEWATANNGNFFMFREMKNGDGVEAAVQNHCRTIILAQDSVHGGGQPFVESLMPSASGGKDHNYVPRIGQAATSPIYPEGSKDLLTKGRTYLDGVQVDGTTHGFLGRPEILSVIPTGDYAFTVFENGYNSERKDLTTCTSAIHGEILMWNRELADAERERVEAYLAWKWLGVVNRGYSALTNATVSGAGAVRAATVAVLPKFASDCTATVEVAGGDLAFNYVSGTIVDARDLGSAVVSFPATMDVNLTFAQKPASGDYPLLSCGAWATTTDFTLRTTGAVGSARVTLKTTETGLLAHVVSAGTLVVIR